MQVIEGGGEKMGKEGPCGLDRNGKHGMMGKKSSSLDSLSPALLSVYCCGVFSSAGGLTGPWSVIEAFGVNEIDVLCGR